MKNVELGQASSMEGSHESAETELLNAEFLDSKELLLSHLQPLSICYGTASVSELKTNTHHDKYWGNSSSLYTDIAQIPALRVGIDVEGDQAGALYFVKDEDDQWEISKSKNGAFYSQIEHRSDVVYSENANDILRYEKQVSMPSGETFQLGTADNEADTWSTMSLEQAPTYIQEKVKEAINQVANPFDKDRLYDGNFIITSKDPRKADPVFLGFAEPDEYHDINPEWTPQEYINIEGSQQLRTAVYSENLRDYNQETLAEKIAQISANLDNIEAPENLDIEKKRLAILESNKAYLEDKAEFERLMKEPGFLEDYFAFMTKDGPIRIDRNDDYATSIFLEFMQSIPVMYNDKLSYPGRTIGEGVRINKDVFAIYDNPKYREMLLAKLEPYGYSIIEEEVAAKSGKIDKRYYIDCPTVEALVGGLDRDTQSNDYIYSGVSSVAIPEQSHYEKIINIIAESKREYHDLEKQLMQEKEKERIKAVVAEFAADAEAHPVVNNGQLCLTEYPEILSSNDFDYGDSAYFELEDSGKYNVDKTPYMVYKPENLIYVSTRPLKNYDKKYLLLDKNKIKTEERNGRSEVNLKHVPDDLRGVIIGKKGANINRLAKELGVDRVNLR